MLNLDTHILVASLAGDLTDRERTLVANQDLAISDIVLWELAKLVELRRLVMDLDSLAFRRSLRHLTIIPISIQMLAEARDWIFHLIPQMSSSQPPA